MNTNIEVFLDGNLVDITNEATFLFNWQIGDVSDLGGKKTSFSKPFILPGTKRNEAVFKNLSDLNSIGYNVKRKADCLVKIDGIELIKGWAKIENVTIKDHAAQSTSYYQITISDEVNNFFTLLKDWRLKDLDLSDFDHLFNLQNVTDSWNDFIQYGGVKTPARMGFGYDYPLVDLGGPFSKPNNVDWYLTGFRPWPFAKTIIDYIFKEAGRTYEGFFDSEYFSKLLISPDSESLKLTSDEMQRREFVVGLQSGYTFSGTYSTSSGGSYANPNVSFTTTYRTLDFYNPPNPGDTGIAGGGAVQPEFNAPFSTFASIHRIRNNEFQTFSDEVYHGGVRYTGSPSLKRRVPFKIKVNQNGREYFDNSGQFDPTTFSYKCSNHSVENISITIPSMFRLHLPNYTWFQLPFPNPNTSPGGYWPETGNEPNPATGGYDGSGLSHGGSGTVYGVYRTWCRRAGGSLELLDTRVENYFYDSTDGLSFKYASDDPTLWRERGYWIYEYIPPTPVPDDGVQFLLNPNDEIYVEFSYLTNLSDDKIKWMFNNSFAGVIHLSTGVDEFKNSPFDNYFLEGNKIELSRMLPDVTVLEFMGSIFNLFNLYIIPDRYRENHFIIKTRDEFFDFGMGVDWTKKLDRTAFEKEPIPLQKVGKWMLNYKKDVDFFNASYDFQSGKTWGEWVEETEGVSGETKLNLIFSPSPLVLDSTTNRRVSRIFTWDGGSKKEVKYNPRILFKSYQNHSGRNLDNFNIIYSGGTYSATRHSTATHLDDPYNPQYDLNFWYNTSPGFYYVNHPLSNRNLYNMFWKNHIENILDPDNYKLIGFFNLNMKDMWSFDFRKPIFIDGLWFYVEKIINWNPARELTKVELIRIRNFNPGDFLGGIQTERPTKGEIGIGSAQTPVGTIKTTKSVRNPDDGLVIGGQVGGIKSPVISIGNNIISGGGKSILVGDGNALVGEGVIASGTGIKIQSGKGSFVSGENIDISNISNSTVSGFSMSVGTLNESQIGGKNIEISEKINESIVWGENIKLIGGDLGFSLTYSSDFYPGPTPSLGVIGSTNSAELNSVFLIGKDLTINPKRYESGLLTNNWYMPSGGRIYDDLDGGVNIQTNAFTFSFGTFSIIPGGRVVQRKDVFITATTFSQTIQTRDEDYLINIQYVNGWAGGTALGDIYIPSAIQWGGREVIYKITSTFSMPGTYFNLSNAFDTIDYKFSKKLFADSQSSIRLVSDGVSNWNIIGETNLPKTTGVGVFYSTGNQAVGTASVPQIISLDTTDISDGIYISGDKIYIDEPATYRMTVSLLVENLSGNIEDVIFFLKFNGATYSNSGHYTTVRERKNPGNPTDIYLSYEFIGRSINPNDYVELWWQASSVDLSLAYTAASGGLPASPSVIVNINKV